MSHLLLGLLGWGLVVLGANAGGWGWLLSWLGGDFLALWISHLRRRHGIFGKRPDGTLPLWSWLLFLPLHLYTLAVWHLLRKLSREPARSVVTEQLVVGRRLLEDELDGDFDNGDFDNYVDLTAEFAEPAVVRGAAAYRSFPILDASAPSPEALREAVDSLRPGRTYVHCAQGHGRTGLFALAVLLRTASAATVDKGLQMLRSVRPGIRLNRVQLRCIQEFAAEAIPNPVDRPIPGWVPSTPEVRSDTLDDILKRHPAVAIHFWAPWNGTDPPMDRTIQAVAPKFAGRLAFFSCNTDREENVELCRRGGVANLPTLWIFVAGQPRQPIIGLSAAEDLAVEIESRMRVSESFNCG